MKVLIFECWHYAPQFETGLEIADLHAEKGDEVTYVNIGGYLPFLEWKITPNLEYNKNVQTIRKIAFKSKMRKTKKVVNSLVDVQYKTLLSNTEINKLRENLTFNNIEELKDYEWEGIDMGMGVASSLISVTNDLSPDVKNRFKIGVENILHAAKISAVSFKKWLDKVNPDLVYFRNGRVALYRPVLRICQQRNVKYLIHDRGCNKYHYKVSPDLRHNFDMVNQEIIDEWNNEIDTDKKKAIAAQYYKYRRQGNENAGKSFINNQKKDTLPENWDNNKYNITFFNSSISEYAAIDKSNDDKPIFDTQIEAINYIAETIKDYKDMQLYLRLHPNLIKQSRKEQDLWMSLKTNPNINLIEPDSKVDTYSLMLNSNLNIAFLSTTAIESAYYNKPTIQLVKSNYYKLGSTYFPKTKQELKDLILNKSLPAKDNLGAIKYGYYKSIFGTRYKYFVPILPNTGTYKGKDLHKTSPSAMFLINFIKTLSKLKRDFIR